MQEVVLFYNGLDVPTRQILDSRGAIPSKTAADAKQPSKKCNTSTTEQPWKRNQKDTAIRNQGASIKTLEIQIGKMSKVLHEKGFGSLPSSTEANPRDQVKSILTTIEADSCPIRRIGSFQYVVSTRQSRTLMYETRQTMILFLRRLNGHYCKEKKGSYGPQFSEAY
ncbi:hypothetical protein Tco_0629355 [Tanacetum coccineum]|uniref:Uncharacterized protein n=1 Tax=Tanacetum coccineum TaxID=301880 RepID=A0ABQ4WT11_9ASTR